MIAAAAAASIEEIGIVQRVDDVGEAPGQRKRRDDQPDHPQRGRRALPQFTCHHHQHDKHHDAGHNEDQRPVRIIAARLLAHGRRIAGEQCLERRDEEERSQIEPEHNAGLPPIGP